MYMMLTLLYYTHIISSHQCMYAIHVCVQVCKHAYNMRTCVHVSMTVYSYGDMCEPSSVCVLCVVHVRVCVQYVCVCVCVGACVHMIVHVHVWCLRVFMYVCVCVFMHIKSL